MQYEEIVKTSDSIDRLNRPSRIMRMSQNIDILKVLRPMT